MSGRTIDDFLGNPEEFDSLTDEQKALLASGGAIEGDTNASQSSEDEEIGKAPDAEGVQNQESEPESSKADPSPVVLAKDGRHTIPFSELEEARERTKQLERELAEIRSKSNQGESPDRGEVPDKKGDESTLRVLSDQLSELVLEREDAFFSGEIEKTRELSLKIAGIQNEMATQAATQAAMSAMEAREAERKAQADNQSAYELGIQRANDLVEKYPFLDPQGQEANQDAIDLVVAQRDKFMANGLSFADAIEKAVGKVAPLFDKRPDIPSKSVANDATKKASEAISKAKNQVPTSLSQVPAGSAVHHDEGEAIREKSGLSLLSAFDGKSADEILKQLSRVI